VSASSAATDVRNKMLVAPQAQFAGKAVVSCVAIVKLHFDPVAAGADRPGWYRFERSRCCGAGTNSGAAADDLRGGQRTQRIAGLA
jgi:hypothetical protein